MRKLMALALLALPCVPALGQGRVGLIGGFVSAKEAASSEGFTVTSSSRSGFAAGLEFAGPLAKDVEIRPEALFVQKGYDQTSGGERETFKLGYVEVPVLVRMAFGTGEVRPFVTAGPAMALRVSCSVSASFPIPSSVEKCQDVDGTDILKKTDIGAVFGAGGTYRQLGFSVRYELGLTNIAENAGSGESLKNRAWFFLVSYVP